MKTKIPRPVTRKKWNVTTALALFVSAGFHGIIFLFIGTVVIFEGKMPLSYFSGDINEQGSLDTSVEAPPMLEEEVPEMTSDPAELVETSEMPEMATMDTTDLIATQVQSVMPAFSLPITAGSAIGPLPAAARPSMGAAPGAGKGKSPGVGSAAALTRFGFVGDAVAGTIQGTFYDFKLNKKEKPSENRPANNDDIFREFTGSQAWAVPDKYDFFKPDTSLFLKTVLFEGVPDREAGEAFQAPDTKAGMWAAHYSGQVTALESGTFRLVGWGDNYMIVGLDGEIILNACDRLQNLGSTKSRGAGSLNVPGKSGAKLFQGDSFRIRKGETYRIDILMGDMGGIFSAGAMVLGENEAFNRNNVFKEYPILCFGELSDAEKELYPFCDDKVLRMTIFQGL